MHYLSIMWHQIRMAFKRSAVCSRLSPPKVVENLGFQRLFVSPSFCVNCKTAWMQAQIWVFKRCSLWQKSLWKMCRNPQYTAISWHKNRTFYAKTVRFGSQKALFSLSVMFYFQKLIIPQLHYYNIFGDRKAGPPVRFPLSTIANSHNINTTPITKVMGVAALWDKKEEDIGSGN